MSRDQSANQRSAGHQVAHFCAATLKRPLRSATLTVDRKQSKPYLWGVEVHLSPERQAQLNRYAERHGQDPAAALDEVLAAALEWELQDYREAVEGIRQGYSDFKAGRTRPVAEAFEELREKHGLPR